jgi:fibronectin-binding autotransporter adhesin
MSKGKKCRLAMAAAILPVLGMSVQPVQGAIVFWDINGATAGASGGATASGTFETVTANWSTDSTGSSATQTFVSGDSVVFSAGTNATGTSTITASGTPTPLGILIEDGTISLAGRVDVNTGTVELKAGTQLTQASSGGATGTGITLTAGGKYLISGNATLKQTNGATGGSFISSVGTIQLANSSNLTVDYSVANSLSIIQTASVISGSGNLIKIGAGVIALAAPSTYNGTTTVTGGELRMRTTANNLPIATALTVTSPGIFNLNGVSTQIGSLTGSGDVGTGSGTLTISGSASTTFTGALKNIANAGAAAVSTGNGRLTKSGSGTITFAGLNDINGSVTLTAGGIIVNAGASLCGPVADVTVNAGTLTLNNAAQTIENLAGTGGSIVLNGTSLISIPTSTADTTSSSTISGTGSLTLNKAGAKLTLAKANTYAGNTTVTAGTLKYGIANALPGGAAKGNVVVNGTLDMNGFGGTINGLSGTGIVDDVPATPATLTLGGNDQTSSFGGTIQSTGAALSLAKTGTGTQTLTGSNTYTGSTAVNAGTLTASAVAAGQALGGTSSVSVNGAGSMLSLGASDEINNNAPFTLNSGTLNTAGFSEGSFDGFGAGVAGVGALTLAADSTIDLDGGSSVLAFADSSGATWTGTTLNIYNWSGTPDVGGGADRVFFGSDANGLDAGKVATLKFYSDAGVTLIGDAAPTILSTGEVVPTFAEVPEPTGIAVVAIGAIGTLARRRRR